jgi:Ca-activated chloride channel homolog
MRTTILLDHEPVSNGHVVRLLLRLEAEAAPRADRLSLNLALVLDRSGSMQGEKLRAARSAAAALVRRLAPDDTVSVVAYDDVVRTIAEPSQGATQADLPRAIERIESGGSTNLSGGWLKGRELVARNLLERGVNRVVLLTDGLANVGLIDRPSLTGLAAQGKKDRVTTTTIGFGEDYDETLLRGMADAGGGNMYYIERPDQALAIFADELTGLLALGAQNVSVVVTPEPAAQLVAVHHAYPTSIAGTSLRVELGDLYAREPKPLLAEFLLRDVAGTDSPVAVLTVEADVIAPDGSVTHQVIRLPVSVSAEEGARVDPDVRRELLLLEAAKARQDAVELRERGDYDGAAQALHAAREKLLACDMADAGLDEEAADLGGVAASLAAHDTSESHRKYLIQRTYNASTGRKSKDRLIRRQKPQKDEDPPAA